ncbi:hypothetical protein [Paraburkholderia sp. J10-1]|uniref:hypothetical protein n=1 Tax=Paraburkholderia sp. J10-1 TaxID=2805430 RepID=UPI002AB6705F|nr:hypothetical protein [Paraburkholderia sp. J10-1]
MQDAKEIARGAINNTGPIAWSDDGRMGIYSLSGGTASFSNFQATSATSDNFWRAAADGCQASHQPAGNWQEALVSWRKSNGSAQASRINTSFSTAVLLYTQPFALNTQPVGEPVATISAP